MAGFKNRKRARRDDDEDDLAASSGDEVARPSKKPSKKTKTGAAGEAQKDADGNPFWSLSATRRVNLSEFKGKMLINIREYWTDQAGELKPGKKGISLSLEQYQSLLNAIPAINSQLRGQGHDVPDVGPAPTSADADEASPEPSAAAPTTKRSKPQKSNIEATSDEESE